VSPVASASCSARGGRTCGWSPTRVGPDANGMEKGRAARGHDERQEGPLCAAAARCVCRRPDGALDVDAEVRVAIAPGATCFEANKVYDHGGVSPQESIVPVLRVSVGAASPAVNAPIISTVRWLGHAVPRRVRGGRTAVDRRHPGPCGPRRRQAWAASARRNFGDGPAFALRLRRRPRERPPVWCWWPRTAGSSPNAKSSSGGNVDRARSTRSTWQVQIFEGYLVRKTSRSSSRAVPVPTYVGSSSSALLRDTILRRSLRASRGGAFDEGAHRPAGEEELFKSRARRRGRG
jgi:hypothetical protein